MADCGLLDLSCKLAETGSEAASTVIDGVIEDVTNAIEESVKMLSTFWVHIPSTGISEATGVTGFLRAFLDPYVAGFVILSIIIGCIKLIFSSNGEPARELASGMFRIIIVAGVSTPLISMMARFTDVVSVAIIDRSIDGGDFGENLWTVMTITSAGNPVVGLFMSILMGVLAVPMAFIQAAMLIIRTIMLPILAGTLVLSASFWTTELGRQWFQRSMVWLIAFLAYKPAAAIVYASGFVLMGNWNLAEATNASTFVIALLSFIQGVTLMMLSILSFGALMGFVVPVSGKLAGGGSGAMFAASAAGIVAAGAISNGTGGGGPESDMASMPSGSNGHDGPAGPGGANGSDMAATAGGAAATGGVGAGLQVAGEAAKGAKNVSDNAVGGSVEDDK